jgi:hypothetical protein
MPSRRLHAIEAEKVAKFSVVGMYLADAGTSFVQHVAILCRDSELRYAMPNVRVWHIGPPLVAGERSSKTVTDEAKCCTAHLVGAVELKPEDLEAIETWLADVDKEDRPTGKFVTRQYIVHPPMQWVLAENKSRLYRRFSCAGFVLDCYRFIGIDLIRDVDADRLPEVDFETIARVYGEEVRRDRIRAFLGIPGPGPWRIVLAGYVMHALNRDDNVIRGAHHLPGSVAEREFPVATSEPEASGAPPA